MVVLAGGNLCKSERAAEVPVAEIQKTKRPREAAQGLGKRGCGSPGWAKFHSNFAQSGV